MQPDGVKVCIFKDYSAEKRGEQHRSIGEKW